MNFKFIALSYQGSHVQPVFLLIPERNTKEETGYTTHASPCLSHIINESKLIK